MAIYGKNDIWEAKNMKMNVIGAILIFELLLCDLWHNSL